jgi:hypothetical protein
MERTNEQEQDRGNFWFEKWVEERQTRGELTKKLEEFKVKFNSELKALTKLLEE